MSIRVVENKDYLIDVAVATSAVVALTAGGWYVKQIITTKLAYRQYKKTRSLMAV